MSLRLLTRQPTSAGRPLWVLLVLAIALVVAAPVLSVAADAISSSGDARLPAGLGDMVLTTTLLLLGVGAGTLVIGGGLAWLVTAYRFPLRGVLSWLLVLPLAMPAYILGFVALSTFDIGGPVHDWIRGVFGPEAWVPRVRNLPTCIAVMSLTLYPYVYLMARAALLEQSRSTYDAARTLGAGRLRTLLSVVLPLARPSLAAGLALVMMETLTDFATVQYFGVRTVSVGVYLTWKGSYDFHTATQLSMLVLTFAVAVLAGERLMRGRSRFHQRGSRGQGMDAVALTGGRAWAATGVCLLALSAAFLLPVVRLLGWAVDRALSGEGLVDARFGEYLGNTLVVAFIAAVGCVTLALLLTHALRITGGRLPLVSAQVTTFGYAVPGAVVGIGVLLAFDHLDRLVTAAGVQGGTGLLVTGSVAGILYAYLIRFLAPAYQAVDASMTKVPPTLTMSALSLGASPRRILTRVHLPLARSGVLVALVLVVIDAVKELPVVLLLRPFGFTTISVWVYQLASENFWEQAALPALLIVAAAIVPVALLFRQVRLVDPHRTPEGRDA